MISTEKASNLKGLGKKQREVLEALKNPEYVLRMIIDTRRGREAVCYLEDDDGMNTYEQLPVDFAQKLYDRGLLTSEDFNPCLGMDIITFRLKPQPTTTEKE